MNECMNVCTTYIYIHTYIPYSTSSYLTYNLPLSTMVFLKSTQFTLHKYIHTYIHTYITYIHTHNTQIHTKRIQTHSHIYIHTYHIHIHICIHIYIHIHTYTYRFNNIKLGYIIARIKQTMTAIDL